MDNLAAARSQMALSLIFHIVFSCIGMVMPFFMTVAHYIYLRKGNPIYKNITIAWSKGVAIFFATGAVSGTVLSFELGLLWPSFMKQAGPIIGMPFSLEGTAFFIEAIALGFFLYGWNRFHPWFHWFTGLLVGITGLLSGVLVVSANSWMNCPSGFNYVNGKFLHIDPIKAMLNQAWFPEALHMIIAAFSATGFAVAGIHALMIKRRQNIQFHSLAFKIAAVFAGVSAVVQPLTGDICAKFVSKNQPVKLAAMEAHFLTAPKAPLIIGGIPDVVHHKVNYDIEVPGLLSFMVSGNTNTVVKGLDAFPNAEEPPVAVVHYAFQLMVALGMAMLGLSLLFFCANRWKRKWLYESWLFNLFAWATPIGFIAVEAGWTVTEVGRQPWIIQGFMRTADAVTPMPAMVYSFYMFTGVYISLSIAVALLLKRQIKMVPVLYDHNF